MFPPHQRRVAVDQTSPKWLFSGLIQQGLCGVHVADGGLLVDAENEGEVKGVGGVGQGFFELAVDVESLQGRGEVAGGPGGPELARRPEFDGRLLGDQQVWVGGARSAGSAVVEPVQDGLAGEVVERADVTGDGNSLVAEIHVVQLHR
ncbi:hypothetical protein QA802_40285 [Streptomyces sp. B21-105]|uniref:hypothetical protein n=1 Tax=Streptomyces sp. B21-105 TaxID=3039417 RepID=UPI002FF21B13